MSLAFPRQESESTVPSPSTLHGIIIHKTQNKNAMEDTKLDRTKLIKARLEFAEKKELPLPLIKAFAAFAFMRDLVQNE